MNTELTCAQCRDALPDYVAGTLTLAASTAVARHLAHCVACQREEAAWRRVATTARRVDARIPTGGPPQAAALWTAIQAQLPSESPFAPGDEFMDFDHSDENADLVSTGPATMRRDQRQRPRVAILAPVAVLLLIALVAGVFALRPQHKGHGVATAPTGTITAPTTPPRSPTPSIADYSVTHVAIIAANNIWAVSDVNEPAPNPRDNTGNGGLLHYNGSAWVADPTVYHNAQLNDISFASASNGWAVGTQSNGPLALHYVNGTWTQVPFDAPGIDLIWVQMLSPDAGWALGTTIDTLASVVFHYSQGRWTQVDFASPTPTALSLPASSASAPQNVAPLSFRHPASSTNPNLPSINQMQMVSDSEGWALGWYKNQNILWHYLNGHWLITDHYNLSTPNFFLTVGANAPNDVWVVEHIPDMVFKHYDGQTWTTQPLNTVVYTIFMGNARWLPITEDSNGYQTQYVTGMFLNQGGQWHSTTLPSTFWSIVNIAPQADGTTLAVAATIDTSPPSALRILRYANGAWSAIG